MPETFQDSVADSLSTETTKYLQYFWIGFVIYASSYSLMVVGITLSNTVAYLQLLGMIISTPMAYVLIKSNITNRYLKTIYTLYCIWVITIILRGFVFEREFLQQMVFDAYAGLFLYLVPLILLFPRNLSSIKMVFNVIITLSVIYIIFILWNLNDLVYIGKNINSQAMVEYFSKTLSIPCGFILLTFIYHSDRRKIWALLVVLLSLILAIIRARRGLMFMTSTLLLLSAVVYFFANKGNLFKRFFPLLLLPVVFMLLNKVYHENESGFFSLITERIDEDTRSGVELYFYNDMEVQDWIIGKGINGLYFCPVGFEIENREIKDYRFGVETDYLTIILKGGIISLGLLLLIAVPALIKGLFYSSNILSKAAGLWILLWIIELYPTTVTTYTMNYLLVWISIGICYSDEIRNMPEDKLKEYLA